MNLIELSHYNSNFKGFKLSPIEIEVKNEERLLDKELFNSPR